MTYATQADIEAAYPTLLVQIADYDGNLAPDVDTVDNALKFAEGIINSHLAMRFALPLPVVPDFLAAACVDIASYRIANSWDRLTDEMRRRYEDVIRHLERIADGKAALGLIDPDPGDDEPIDEVTPGRAGSFKSIRSA